MGHCAALYQQNHAAIAQLEMRLQQYGYRDLYAPLPPENPLDMLMLRSTGGWGCVVLLLLGKAVLCAGVLYSVLHLRLLTYSPCDASQACNGEDSTPSMCLWCVASGGGQQQPLQSARGARTASPGGGTHSPDGLHLREPLDHITNSLAATNLHDSTPGGRLGGWDGLLGTV